MVVFFNDEVQVEKMWKLVFFMRSQEWVELLELQEHDEKTMALKKQASPFT